LNSYKLSVKDWVAKTNALDLKTTGRYGGMRILMCLWIWNVDPEFKIYLIKEFQRLKAVENDHLQLEWNLQRTIQDKL
jgi:hypothetical protein